MGYESKIVVIDRREHEATGKHPAWVYGSEIARFDLSKMGYERVDGKEFREVFSAPIDFDLYVANDDGEIHPDEYWREDCYGEHCKMASVDDVLQWLEKSEVLKEYRRAKLFYDFLRVLKEHENEYQQIVLVHYGY